MTNKHEVLLETQDTLTKAYFKLTETINASVINICKSKERLEASRLLVTENDEFGAVFLDIIENAYQLDENRYKALCTHRNVMLAELQRLNKLLATMEDPLAYVIDTEDDLPDDRIIGLFTEL